MGTSTIIRKLALKISKQKLFCSLCEWTVCVTCSPIRSPCIQSEFGVNLHYVYIIYITCILFILYNTLRVKLADCPGIYLSQSNNSHEKEWILSIDLHAHPNINLLIWL